MSSLIIAHQAKSDPPQFEVFHRERAQHSPAVALATPYDYPVPNQPVLRLMNRLRWYLEQFLQYPFSPNTEQAADIEAALQQWGEETFTQLFGAGKARDWMTDAKRAQAAKQEPLHIQISSDDPAILSWPWEALRDPETGILAHQARIERRLNDKVPEPAPLAEQLPRDVINILLVTARPYEQDVQYRSITRPLIELIGREKLPARVHILRPPTFDQLRAHLREKPGFYHILHFDGHGAFAPEGLPGAVPGMLRGPVGQLIFENATGEEDPKSAADLSELLREYAVPLVVLNACQSAMLDESASDPFATVAAALLKTGIRAVVAMTYSVTVRGAQEFLPPFYRALFASGSVTEAARLGRQEMLAHPERSGYRRELRLADWLVPVVYQQDQLDFSFVSGRPTPATPEQAMPLPAAVTRPGTYRFTGRDGEFLELERARWRAPAGILIHGLGGVGKTTLTAAFVRWLHGTGGLGHGCFWFAFNELRSAAAVFNELGRALAGGQFNPPDTATAARQLATAFHEHPFILVWDNFESVCGIPDTEVTPQLPPEDQALLKGFLAALRGGKTKVLITSRSDEEWLTGQNRFKVQLRGLAGDEVWEYAAAILDDLKIKADRGNADLGGLLKLLGGHPLAMQVVLAQLEKRPLAQVKADWFTHLTEFAGQTDARTAPLLATLELARRALPMELHPLLIPLALHEKFVDARLLPLMAEAAQPSLGAAEIQRFVAALSPAGLLTDLNGVVFELHPLLTSYLRARILPGVEPAAREAWTRAFADVLGSLADALAPKQLHEQQGIFAVHFANFHAALRDAERLHLAGSEGALVQSLAVYAQNKHDLEEAERLFQRYARHCEQSGDESRAAAPYHQLGRIAAERRDFAGAEQWYLKSLVISEKQGNEHGTAMARHQLGMVAQQRRDLATAEQWYLKSLAISEKQRDDQTAAITYHQLGTIAAERRAFAVAEQWYLKSLAIKEKQRSEPGAAMTYHQLGMIAQERQDWAAAERWYLKSLAISEKQGYEQMAGTTYHQLGIIAAARLDVVSAERWYLKSLAISEKQSDEHGAASTFHQLGVLALVRRDFASAERWYLKALAIKEKQGNEYGAASTYHDLGLVALAQGQQIAAGQWVLRALRGMLNANDEHHTRITVNSFIRIFQSASPADQTQLRVLWKEANVGDFPKLDK